MKRKYINIFWASLAIIIILNELVIGKIELKSISQFKTSTWLLIIVWLSVAIKNIYSFYAKQIKFIRK